MIRLLAIAALPLFWVPSQDADSFPVAKGTSWIYDVDGKEQPVIAVDPEKIGDTDCATFVTPVADGSCKTEWYAVGKDGVTFRGNRMFDGVQSNETRPDPPILRLKFGTKKGDTWEWKGTVAGRNEAAKYLHEGTEEIQVPAGRYSCIKVTTTAEGQQGGYSVARWYANRVGLVKAVVKAGDKETVTELKKFQAPK